MAQNLGKVTAYGYAKAGGYTGTEEQFTTMIGNLDSDASSASASATSASQSAASASQSATTATNAMNTVTEAIGEAISIETRRYTKKYTISSSTSSFTFNPTGYTYSEGDRFEVFVDGVKLVEDTYSNSSNVITLTTAVSSGTVEIIGYKNVGLETDSTLTLPDAAADAKVTGDEINNLKDDLNELLGEVTLFNGVSSYNQVLFTSSDVDIGATVSYYIKLPANPDRNRDGYIELYDANSTRLGIYGRTAGGNQDTEFSGTFSVPSGFVRAVWHGNETPISVVIKTERNTVVRCDIVQGLTDEEKAQARENIGAVGATYHDVVFYDASASVGTQLFTSDDAPEGTHVTYDILMTVTSGGYGAAGFIELVDSQNNRLGTYGRTATSQHAETVYQGEFDIPEGFDHANWYGPSGQPTSNATSVKLTKRVEGEISNYVRYDEHQDLTEEQKAQARENIGVSSVGGLFCSGNYSVGDTLFDNTVVSAGETLYYKIRLTEAHTSGSGYVQFQDSSNNSLGSIGLIAGEQTKVNETRMGVVVVPTGFSHAKWNGSWSGVVEYITRFMPDEYFNKFYCGKKVDLLKDCVYLSGYAYDPNTKAQASSSSSGVTSYIPVAPHGRITITKQRHSKSFGHGFFNLKTQVVEQYASVKGGDDVVTLEVPEGAFYVRITFALSIMADTHAYYEPPAIDNDPTPEYELNPYTRRAIKEYGAYYLTEEFTHCAFPRMCYFNGMKIISYRCGYKHDSRTESSLYGRIQIDAIDADNIRTHCKQFVASDFGCTGDARESFLGVSKDGNYLIMLATFCYGTTQSPSQDCAVVCLDKDFDVVDYKKVVSGARRFLYGKPLFTPEGRLIFNAYSNVNTQTIYRSTETFSGSVSELTFAETTVLDTGNVVHNEACMGYHNGKLYMLIRYDAGAGKIMWTSDLEGTTGWSNPIEIGAKIHSPMLLPHYNGEHIPFVSSYYDSANATYRKPAVGYLDVDTENQTATIIGIGDLDSTLDTAANNGYPDFIHLGGENYAVAYYQEDATPTYNNQNQQAGVYYKYINAREIIPSAAYFLD